MGSDSDLPVMQEAANLLDELEIPYEITIVSAHRTPERMYKYAKDAADRGIQTIIAGAGGSAHLPGMTAALTTLPVIGVPIKTKNMDGLDSLLSIVQMPPGIPVATVAINGAKNAGRLAAKIIGTSDKTVRDKLEEYAKNMEDSVIKKVENLDEVELIGPLETLHAGREFRDRLVFTQRRQRVRIGLGLALIVLVPSAKERAVVRCSLNVELAAQKTCELELDAGAQSRVELGGLQQAPAPAFAVRCCRFQTLRDLVIDGLAFLIDRRTVDIATVVIPAFFVVGMLRQVG